LESALAKKEVNTLGGIIENMRASDSSSIFMVKYRMRRMVVEFVQKFDTEKKVDKKLELLQKFSTNISYG
jgi:nitrogenase subunit NifH